MELTRDKWGQMSSALVFAKRWIFTMIKLNFVFSDRCTHIQTPYEDFKSNMRPMGSTKYVHPNINMIKVCNI